MEPFIGQIIMFGGNFAPRGWALCDGQLLQISTNTALFSILGTIYGGDGRTNFALPDMRGRAPVHAGNGAGLPNVNLGEHGGNPTTILTEANLPSHTHDAKATQALAIGVSTKDGDQASPSGNILGAGGRNLNFSSSVADAEMAANSISGEVTVVNSRTGDNAGFSNQSPYQSVNFIIALMGTFPSRS